MRLAARLLMGVCSRLTSSGHGGRSDVELGLIAVVAVHHPGHTWGTCRLTYAAAERKQHTNETNRCRRYVYRGVRCVDRAR